MKKYVKTLISLILLLSLTLCLTSCKLINKESTKNVFEDINPLDDYEVKIVKNIQTKPSEKSSPKLVYASSQDAVILNHNGIIVINVPYGKIMHAVDNQKIGLNKLEGEDMTMVESCGDELLIYNINDDKKKNAIEMDIHSLTIKSKPDLKDKNYQKVNLLNDKIIMDKISNEGKNEVQAIQISDNDILAFEVDDKSSTKNWQISIYDKESLKPVRSFLIFK